MDQTKNSFFESQVAAAAALGLGIIIAAAIGAYAFYSVRALDNTLSVTGSAKTRVQADSAKWNFSISRSVYESNVQSGYAMLARDLESVKQFLSLNGIAETDYTLTPVFTDEIYKYNQTDGPREFNLRQHITIQSSDIEKITALSKNVQALINKGVLINVSSPEYYYSKLNELRVSLLSDAIKDAQARAAQIAQSSGQKVGKLKSAASGVVQVLAPNSIEVSDYGQYDTSSIDKDVMVTVRATFLVK